MGTLTKMTRRMDWIMMMMSFTLFRLWTCLMVLKPTNGASRTGRFEPFSVPLPDGRSRSWLEFCYRTAVRA